jgi:hypothetical protein
MARGAWVKTRGPAALLGLAAFLTITPASAGELAIAGKSDGTTAPFAAKIVTSGDDDICDVKAERPSKRACEGLDVPALRAEDKNDEDRNRDLGLSVLAHAFVLRDVWGAEIAVTQQTVDTTAPIERPQVALTLRKLAHDMRAKTGSDVVAGEPNIVLQPNPSGWIDVEHKSGADMAFTRVYSVYGPGAVYLVWITGPVTQRAGVIELSDAIVATISVPAPVPTAEGTKFPWWAAFLPPLVLLAWFLIRREAQKHMEARAEHLARPEETETDVKVRRERRRKRRAAEREETEASDADGAS